VSSDFRRFGLVAVAAACVAAPRAAHGQHLRGRVAGLNASLGADAAEHRVDAGDGVERSAGGLVRVELRYPARDWLEVRGSVARGSLAARTDSAADRDVSELALGAAVTPLRWLALDAGTSVRRYTSALADQRWVGLHVGAEARLALLGDGLRGVVRAALLPAVSVTGQPAPDVALAAGAGLEARRDRLSAALTYSLERYDFPAVLRVQDNARVRRLEQFSTLGVRVGLRL